MKKISFEDVHYFFNVIYWVIKPWSGQRDSHSAFIDCTDVKLRQRGPRTFSPWRPTSPSLRAVRQGTLSAVTRGTWDFSSPCSDIFRNESSPLNGSEMWPDK